jgi:8-oxo-dGTP diphosphatase
VVDVANVMGARPDGWWRDRAGAALRLGREVGALARRGDEATADVTGWVLVIEGQARGAVPALLADEGEPPAVRVVSAPGSGDDAIVGVVAEVVASDETCLVVTADRELRRRCEELNASVVGPGWLLRLLQQVTLKNNHHHPRIARCGHPVPPQRPRRKSTET